MRIWSSLCLALSLVVLGLPASAWAPSATDPSWPLQVFAHRCADVTFRPGEYRAHCAADGAVAALQAPVDAHLAHALGATRAWRTEGAVRHLRPTSVTVSLRGELVVVEHVTCASCRRVMGVAWVLRPERAPDALLRTVQRAAGLPEGTPLRTAAAWRAARP